MEILFYSEFPLEKGRGTLQNLHRLALKLCLFGADLCISKTYGKSKYYLFVLMGPGRYVGFQKETMKNSFDPR